MKMLTISALLLCALTACTPKTEQVASSLGEERNYSGASARVDDWPLTFIASREMLQSLSQSAIKADLKQCRQLWHSLYSTDLDPSGRDLFMWAADGNYGALLEKMSKDMSAGEINRQDSQGRTALMYAARQGSNSSLEHLLALPGINLDLQDKLGRSALMQAAMQGHRRSVVLLLDAGANPDLLDHEAMAASHLSWQRQHDEIMLDLFNCVAGRPYVQYWEDFDPASGRAAQCLSKAEYKTPQRLAQEKARQDARNQAELQRYIANSYWREYNRLRFHYGFGWGRHYHNRWGMGLGSGWWW